jgi:hypothetical protein
MVNPDIQNTKNKNSTSSIAGLIWNIAELLR